MDYPDDADGETLRRIAQRCDMTLPIDIDFAVAVATRESGDAVANAAKQVGYSANVEHDDVADVWTCCCTKRMVPTYEAVVAAQAELDELSAPFGGYCDGWGTLGE